MARHKKKLKKQKTDYQEREAGSRKLKAGSEPWHSDLKPETKKSILAVCFFLLTALTLLSYWQRAGVLGNYFARILTALVGKGYFFAPLTFLLVAFSFLFSVKRDEDDLPRHVYSRTFIGGGLFLLSTLGLLDLFGGAKAGGFFGYWMTKPLFHYFDFWATLLIEGTLGVVSLLILMNVPLHGWLSWGTSEEETEGIEEDAEPPHTSLDTVAQKVEAVVASVAASVKERETAVAAMPPVKKEEKEDEIMLEKRRVKFAYKRPPFSLLNSDSGTPSSGDIRANANIIKRTLQNFGIDVEMDEVSVGPTVTQYTLKPAQGVKLAKITALHNDLSLALAAHPIRIEAPIPGKSLVGIEIPNRSIMLVGLRSLLDSPAYQESSAPLLFALGRDVAGEAAYANLAKMPHLLIAGSTGSGKSVNIHTILMSLLYRNPPELLRFILIDPKRVELSMYNEIPHLLTPVIHDGKKTIQSLRWCVHEMERRYEMLSHEHVRDLASYNAKIAKQNDSEKELIPYIVIVIDELADLMMAFPREVEAAIVRLAQMARAIGIHLIVSTQRPSVEVITGLIKANITSRIAFQVASQVDSRTILDMSGAEKLLGNGDMLFLAGDTAKPRRIQGAFVSEAEVKKVVEFLKNEVEEPQYEEGIFAGGDAGQGALSFDDMDGGSDDELYEEARRIVVEAGKASSSYLQRRLKVGYARAARLLDMLEEHGIVGPGDGAKPRDILMEPSDKEEDAPLDEEGI
ncbi:MAG: DNA translocase FtsK [bacterium]|nr:DNA translocase FtsK [bacterium]